MILGYTFGGTTMTTTRTNGERTRSRPAEAGADLAAGARTVADGVAGAAGTVISSLPTAAANTRAAVDEAARLIDGGSDEMLTIGTTFSLGLATGLLVGGAPRLLVAGALVPVAAMGLTLLDRGSAKRRRVAAAS
jgi:hypothetical protein